MDQRKTELSTTALILGAVALFFLTSNSVTAVFGVQSPGESDPIVARYETAWGYFGVRVDTEITRASGEVTRPSHYPTESLIKTAATVALMASAAMWALSRARNIAEEE